MNTDELHLLLFDPDKPDAYGPLSKDTLGQTTDPEAVPEAEAPDTLRHAGSMNNIDQGWGVLYPDTAEGTEKLAAISELVRWRDEEIKKTSIIAGVRTWAIPEGQRANAFLLDTFYRLRTREKPLFLLILGDFDGIPLEFERVLSDDAIVGRLALPTLEDYRAYAKKVVTSEKRPRRDDTRETPRVVVYNAHVPGRGTFDERALEFGHTHMIVPLIEHLEGYSVEKLQLEREGVFRCGPAFDTTWGDTRARVAAPSPSILVSLSHGEGKRAWNFESQRQHQGGMLREYGERISLADVAREPFLPEGMWFYNACYSAGTPSHSAYANWVRRLKASRIWPSGFDVTDTLARERAFVARQPQLALANPQGPLVVFGHIDIAFTYNFSEDLGQRSIAPDSQHAVPQSICNFTDQLIQGSRAGVALREFQDPIHTASREIKAAYTSLVSRSDAVAEKLIDKRYGELASQYHSPVDDAVRALLARGRESVTLSLIAQKAGVHELTLLAAHGNEDTRNQLRHRYHNWMAYHDLKSWIILGDPAARLPVRKNQPRPLPDPETFFGADFQLARERGADQANETTHPTPAITTPAGRAAAELPVPPALPSALPDDELLAAIRAFVGAATQSDKGAVADEHGADYADLKRWDDYVNAMLRWSFERCRSSKPE